MFLLIRGSGKWALTTKNVEYVTKKRLIYAKNIDFYK